MKLHMLAIPMVALLLEACSMTGYGGTSKFRCRDGSSDPACESISRTYNASVAGVLGNEGMIRQAADRADPNGTFVLMHSQAPQSGMPIRSEAEIARIWIAPYLDTDGDLIDQSFTYVTLNTGKWLIAHNQQQIMDEFRPIRLLGSGKADDSEETVPGRNDAIATSGMTHTQQPPQGVPDVGMDIKQLSQTISP